MEMVMVMEMAMAMETAMVTGMGMATATVMAMVMATTTRLFRRHDGSVGHGPVNVPGSVVLPNQIELEHSPMATTPAMQVVRDLGRDPRLSTATMMSMPSPGSSPCCDQTCYKESSFAEKT